MLNLLLVIAYPLSEEFLPHRLLTYCHKCKQRKLQKFAGLHKFDTKRSAAGREQH